ncbi:MAG TPA: hypothetical protein VFF59_02270 [Anaerolineae bacterium]|nr:hypothetical protein [Anaerolineae bacterium]
MTAILDLKRVERPRQPRGRDTRDDSSGPEHIRAAAQPVAQRRPLIGVDALLRHIRLQQLIARFEKIYKDAPIGQGDKMKG